MKLSLIMLVIVAIIVVSFVVSKLSPNQQGEVGGGKISSPLGAELLVEDNNLMIGETTKLTLRAFIEKWAYSSDPNTGINRLPNVTMTFKLPDNLDYVSGDLSWQGSIEGRQVEEIKIIVRAKDKGTVTAYGNAINYEGTNYFGRGDFEKICIVGSLTETCAEEITSGTQTTAIPV